MAFWLVFAFTMGFVAGSFLVIFLFGQGQDKSWWFNPQTSDRTIEFLLQYMNSEYYKNMRTALDETDTPKT